MLCINRRLLVWFLRLRWFPVICGILTSFSVHSPPSCGVCDMSCICAFMLTFTAQCCVYLDLLQISLFSSDQFSTPCALACTTGWYPAHERCLWCICFTLAHFSVHFSMRYDAFVCRVVWLRWCPKPWPQAAGVVTIYVFLTVRLFDWIIVLLLLTSVSLHLHVSVAVLVLSLQCCGAC